MKERELRKHLKCGLCHKPITASGLPLFWRVTVERFGLELKNIQRQHGLALMMGHAGLAEVMGPDLDMATPIGEPLVATVCETCAMEDGALMLPRLAELQEKGEAAR